MLDGDLRPGPSLSKQVVRGRGVAPPFLWAGLQGIGLVVGLLKELQQVLCVVVGEPAYYAPFGFRNASAAGLILPGPVEPERFQVLEIVPGALAGVSGLIGKAEEDGAPGRGLRSGSAA